jgi:hypothetical protein
MKLRTVSATRYVTPLREGGSLPAILEADDEGTYVVKFRGAGQGAKALVAELVSGEIARVLGLPVPEIVFMQLDPVLGRAEPDPEIQDLLKASAGLNLALDYLPGSITFDPLVAKLAREDPEMASSIVWLDALTTNVDRTPRNPNLLVWHHALWLIDHGASLYFHHAWDNYLERAQSRFPAIKDHVLLPFASKLEEADARLSPLLSPQVLESIVSLIPDEWLGDVDEFASVEEHRAAYSKYLQARLESPRGWAEEARDARKHL